VSIGTADSRTRNVDKKVCGQLKPFVFGGFINWTIKISSSLTTDRGERSTKIML